MDDLLLIPKLDLKTKVAPKVKLGKKIVLLESNKPRKENIEDLKKKAIEEKLNAQKQSRENIRKREEALHNVQIKAGISCLQDEHSKDITNKEKNITNANELINNKKESSKIKKNNTTTTMKDTNKKENVCINYSTDLLPDVKERNEEITKEIYNELSISSDDEEDDSKKIADFVAPTIDEDKYEENKPLIVSTHIVKFNDTELEIGYKKIESNTTITDAYKSIERENIKKAVMFGQRLEGQKSKMGKLREQIKTLERQKKTKADALAKNDKKTLKELEEQDFEIALKRAQGEKIETTEKKLKKLLKQERSRKKKSALEISRKKNSVIKSIKSKQKLRQNNIDDHLERRISGILKGTGLGKQH